MATKKTTTKKAAQKNTKAPEKDNGRLKKLLLILALLVIAYFAANELIFKPSAKRANEPITITGGDSKSTESALTAETVAKHATAEDCWLIIDKKVYNATSLVANHSGGAKNITDYCGKDASAAWNTKNKAVAKVHSEAAKALLSKNVVGDLK